MFNLKIDQNFRSREGHVKRPMNAFLVFAKENRCKIRRLNPSFSNKRISESLGRMWSRMSPEEKFTYHLQARAIELEHQKLYPEYTFIPKRKRPPMQSHMVSLPGELPGKSCSQANNLKNLQTIFTEYQPRQPVKPVSLHPLSMVDMGDNNNSHKQHHIDLKPNVKGGQSLLSTQLPQDSDANNARTGNPSSKKPRMISLLKNSKLHLPQLGGVLNRSSKSCQVSDCRQKADTTVAQSSFDQCGIESLARPTAGSDHRHISTVQYQSFNHQVSTGQTPIKLEKCLNIEDMEVCSINSSNHTTLYSGVSSQSDGLIQCSTADRGDMGNIVNTLNMSHNAPLATSVAAANAEGLPTMATSNQVVKTEKLMLDDFDMCGSSIVNNTAEGLDTEVFEDILKHIKTEALTSEDMEVMCGYASVETPDGALGMGGFKTESIEQESFAVDEKCGVWGSEPDTNVTRWFESEFDTGSVYSYTACGSVILQRDGMQYLLQRIHTGSPAAEMADNGDRLFGSDERDNARSPGVTDPSSLLEFIHSIAVPYLRPLLDEDSTINVTISDIEETKNAVAALLACM